MSKSKSGGTLDWYFEANSILEKTEAEYVIMVRHPKSESVWSMYRIKDRDTADGMMDCFANILGNEFGEGWFGRDKD